jgi:hypothetical protein
MSKNMQAKQRLSRRERKRAHRIEKKAVGGDELLHLRIQRLAEKRTAAWRSVLSNNKTLNYPSGYLTDG